MDEEFVKIPKKRARKTGENNRITISIPIYIDEIVDEEAREKETSKSVVINYLIYTGLKAHIGQFKPPKDNTIMKNYLKRGKIWKIPKKSQ
jgi:transcriptional regulator of met regulon